MRSGPVCAIASPSCLAVAAIATGLIGGKSLWTARVSKESRVRHGAQLELSVDTRYLLTHLAARYPSCWTFSVDGLVGATPEMLVRL